MDINYITSTSEVDTEVVQHQTAELGVPTPGTYVYCCGKVSASAPGHDTLTTRMIWRDIKRTKLQHLSPLAIFHLKKKKGGKGKKKIKMLVAGFTCEKQFRT